MSNSIPQLHAALSLLKIQVQEFRKILIATEKEIKKERLEFVQTIKQQRKDRRMANAERRKPSGFCTPVKLSNALCDFLDVPHDSTAVRPDVTKTLCAYIKTNGLYNKDAKIIVPDAKLAKLFERSEPFTDDNQLTYFTIQRHMNCHYSKI